MINAIELIRVSTELQASADRASIPAQRSVNRETAARFGLKIVASIELSDVSGASVLLTPEIQHLIQLIQGPEIDAVVTREFSRLIRPEKFSDYALLQAFVDSNTKLYLPEGPIDFSEKTGRLMGTIRAAIAGLERAEIKERCWRGKEEKRKQGKKVESSLAFGVGYDKARGWFYTDDAEKVRQAFEMILSGETRYNVIAARTGCRKSTMFELLHNPIWIGWRIYDRKVDPTKRHTRGDGRQGWIETMPRSPDEIIRVKVIEKPLISEEQWNAACGILDMKRGNHRRERATGNTSYSGFLFCALCGSPMRPVKVASGKYYVCRNRKLPGVYGPKCDHPYLRVDRMEEEVNRFLSREVTGPEFAQRIAARLTPESVSNRRNVRIARLRAELESLGTKRDRIIDLVADGLISPEKRDERLRGIAELEEKASREFELSNSLQMPILASEQIAEVFQVFADWEFLGREDRRRILAVTIPRIRVHGYCVRGIDRLFDGCGVGINFA